MAGAGYKTFNTGDVLTASDVMTYLMQQTVMVFDDAAARTTALTGVVAEGMMSYLKDTNKTYRYDGSAWLDDAGTTSPLTTKGDVWGYSTTDARIPVGANGTVLTADSAEALGVKWAAAAGGGSLTQLATGSLSGSSTSITSISGSYTHLQLVIYEMSADFNGYYIMRFNSDSGSNYYSVQTDSLVGTRGNNAAAQIMIQTEGNLGTNTQQTNTFNIYNYASTSIRKCFDGVWFGYRNTVGLKAGGISGLWNSLSAISSIQIIPEAGNSFDNGSYILYGVN